jgi:hypothetical protein
LAGAVLLVPAASAPAVVLEVLLIASGVDLTVAAGSAIARATRNSAACPRR